MSQSKTKNTSDDLFASLMEELKIHSLEESQSGIEVATSDADEATAITEMTDSDDELGLLDLNFGHADEQSAPVDESLNIDSLEINSLGQSDSDLHSLDAPEVLPVDASSDDFNLSLPDLKLVETEDSPSDESTMTSEKTEVLASTKPQLVNHEYTDNERTVAVNGFSNRQSDSAAEQNVRVSVGQSYGAHSPGYGSWGSTDSHLSQVENLKIAQAKILELEKENEKLRQQNDELMSATEIVKERSELLTAQVYEYKNDRESLQSSFKSEVSLLKNQLHRKDIELQKSQMKIEELDSRLKFDMKKIRIRERELENRLELIRAEKNALVRTKDDQILEIRRKIDQLQLEVESYRQKCVDLNKVIDTNQESFKRTTRALRLAMANLELQEENKTPLKKVD